MVQAQIVIYKNIDFFAVWQNPKNAVLQKNMHLYLRTGWPIKSNTFIDSNIFLQFSEIGLPESFKAEMAVLYPLKNNKLKKMQFFGGKLWEKKIHIKLV